MERRISIWLYVSAFALSVAMFAIGLYIGTLIDSSNMESLSGDVSTISEKVSSLQLLLLMEENASYFCPVYLSELKSIDEDVENLGYKLSYLEDVKSVSDPELKKRYFVLEAESYLLSKKVKTLCSDDSILLVHFYSNKDCEDCRAQGQAILQVRDSLQDEGIRIKLFSFDGELGSPVADAFKNMYGIKRYPSVVINDSTYPGFQNSTKLEKIIGNAS